MSKVVSSNVDPLTLGTDFLSVTMLETRSLFLSSIAKVDPHGVVLILYVSLVCVEPLGNQNYLVTLMKISRKPT